MIAHHEGLTALPVLVPVLALLIRWALARLRRR